MEHSDSTKLRNFEQPVDIDDVLFTEEQKVEAIQKIQRQARKKRALEAAKAEQQWKMFSDLDTQDEAEMLHLAVFMQTLLDVVPKSNQKVDQDFLKSQLSRDEDDDDAAERALEVLNGPESFMLARQDSVQTYITLESINLSHNPVLTNVLIYNENDDEYEIPPHHDITSQVVQDIVEVYRHHQRLGRATILKILRKVYKTILKMKNITRITIDNESKCTIVGDLHGQLSDLFHILDTSGFPNKQNKFIFNGDFVDRGESGLEIVVLIFAFFVSEGPEVVGFNRGNHEDHAVCRVYGFENEVKSKYDDLLFEMFAEVFNNLPLFTLINSQIFIVHGGLFHDPLCTLSDLEDIPRNDYFIKPPVPFPENTRGLSPDKARIEYLKQLQRDALWSDPTADDGCYLNSRGAGVTFGPNIAKQFMSRNHLTMVIRSHECVLKGFDLPYVQEPPVVTTSSRFGGLLPLIDRNRLSSKSTAPPPPLLCTLFSASNYIGGDNEGAILQITTLPTPTSSTAGDHLYYTVHRYKTSEATQNLQLQNHLSLKELILRKKTALLLAFENIDKEKLGVVSRIEWADIMQKITNIKIRWLGIINTIAPTESLSPTSVAYRIFLNAFSVDSSLTPATASEATRVAIDDMYGQRRQLETVFYFFDTNGDGVISREEFRNGCEVLNKSLHPDCQLTNIDRTLALMDFDGSGTIDINEFFETFRILDAKDGKVDGVLSLATKAQAVGYKSNNFSLPPPPSSTPTK